jgi:4-amino-4-deoxy-L-arabinose transferase-like glycosyltransferase
VIIWDAFYTYFLMTGERVKLFAFLILVTAFFLRKNKTAASIISSIGQIQPHLMISFILLVAVSLRVGWILWSPHIGPSAGTEDYIMLRHARELAAGQGYISTAGEFSADRPIGHALWLALIFKLFGENIWLIESLQVLFSAVAVFLVYRVARCAFSAPVSYLAAFLLAVYPPAIFATKILLEEHLFIILWLGGILILISDFQKPAWRKIISAGLLFGIAAHFRTHAFLMGALVLFAWLVLKRGFWQGFARALVVQALIIGCALPWAVRNYARLGAPILYSTWVGPAFYYANNSVSNVRYPVNPIPEEGGDMDFLTANSEVGRNRTGMKAAVEWILGHPGTFLQKSVGRAIYMLGLNREGWTVQDNFHTIREGRDPPSTFLKRQLDKMDNDYYGIIFLLSLFGVGFFLLMRRKISNWPSGCWILMTLLYYIAICAITIGYRKYRLPIEPLFCMFAAYGIAAAWAGLKTKKVKQATQ